MPRSRHRVLTALTVTVAVVLAACGGGAKRQPTALPTTTTPTTAAAPSTTEVTSPPASTPKFTLNFTPCPSGEGFLCASAKPPLDYRDPDGPTQLVRVTKLPASGPAKQRIGTLFVNPGGPGASAIDFVHDIRQLLPRNVLARFDLIAFDPRGVGASDGIECESGAELDRFFAVDPTPDNPAERQALIDTSRQFAAECAQRNPAELAHVDTRTVARDWDLIRQALGEDKITYLGFSYGTFLGAMYADMFPSHVRAFVLDGAIDPSLSMEEVNHQQAVGFEKELALFLADCAAKISCPFHSGGNPGAAFESLSARIDRTPIPTNSGRSVGPGEFFFAVARSLYSQSSWPGFATALQQAATQGQADDLLALSDNYTERKPDGTYGDLLSANNAVNCLDRPAPKDPAAYDAQAARFATDSPHFGAALAYGGLVCGLWPFPATDQPRPLRAAGSAPIVVIGTTNDPATPYAWAQALAGQLEHGVLVTHEGNGHTAFGTSNGSQCIPNLEWAYLLDLTVPPPNTTCR